MSELLSNIKKSHPSVTKKNPERSSKKNSQNKPTNMINSDPVQLIINYLDKILTFNKKMTERMNELSNENNLLKRQIASSSLPKTYAAAVASNTESSKTAS